MTQALVYCVSDLLRERSQEEPIIAREESRLGRAVSALSVKIPVLRFTPEP